MMVRRSGVFEKLHPPRLHKPYKSLSPAFSTFFRDADQGDVQDAVREREAEEFVRLIVVVTADAAGAEVAMDGPEVDALADLPRVHAGVAVAAIAIGVGELREIGGVDDDEGAVGGELLAEAHEEGFRLEVPEAL